MNQPEAAKILVKIAAYDRRTIGLADVEAWLEALDGIVTFDEALIAVRDHYRESREFMMPSDLIKLARKNRVRVRPHTGELKGNYA